MNLADLLVEYDARKTAEDVAKARADEIRAEISEALMKRWREEGTKDTVRHPDKIASAWLAGGEPKVYVSQPQAFADWAAEHDPEAVSLVITVPRKRVDSDEFARILTALQMLATDMHSEVDEYLLPRLIAAGTADVESGRLTLGDEAVDGVSVAAREPYLAIKRSPK